MSTGPADHTAPAGTAGRLAGLLRQGERTVDDLAEALGLTGNAVRLHLTRLERDGVVERGGLRAGVSRPSVLYRLTSDGELRYSRAYVPVLTQLLHVLAARLPRAQFDALLRQVGRELMAGRPRPVGTLQQRAEHGSALLNELGGLSHVARKGKQLVIRGDACPPRRRDAKSPGGVQRRREPAHRVRRRASDELLRARRRAALLLHGGSAAEAWSCLTRPTRRLTPRSRLPGEHHQRHLQSPVRSAPG